MQTKKPASGGVKKPKAKPKPKASAAANPAAKPKTPKEKKKEAKPATEAKPAVGKKKRAAEEIDGLFGQLKGATAKKAKVGGRGGAL
jgi:hypothetical protein